MRVLMVTLELPRPGAVGTWAPVARQIDSLRRRGVHVEVVQVAGVQKLKYLHASPRIVARASRFDLVHAHFGYCAWIARLQWRRPLVVSFMGSDLLGTSNGDGHVT